MKYLYWRGKSLWCSFPLPGYPKLYSLGIKTTGTATDRRKCEKAGEDFLLDLRLKAKAGKLIEKKTEKEPEDFNPKYWRLVGRYWYYNLRFKKSGSNERFHLIHSLKRFGDKYAKDITREDVELWRQEMVKNGSSINSVNNRFAYLQAVYNWSNKESVSRMRIGCDPTTGLKKLPGGKVRTFVLTKEKFERNYEYLKFGERHFRGKPNKHCTEWRCPPDPRFALFYLALWETGRRPLEVSQYTWDMLTVMEIDGRQVRYISVPPELSKTNQYGVVIISDRLWGEISQLAYRHGYIFRNHIGNRWQHWGRHKNKLERKFGPDCGWIRDTRRGFVTHKTEVQGFDPVHVRAQSGHKTESIFNRYRIGTLRNQASIMDPQSIDITSQCKETVKKM